VIGACAPIHPASVKATRPDVHVRAGLLFWARQREIDHLAGAGETIRTAPADVRPVDDHMQRVTITIDDELMTELDRIIAARGYQNRSEAIRDLARAGIRQAAETLDKQRDCVAALVYVYDHNARQLSKRLADTFHDHHELSLASMHAHLDYDSCMEVTILRGKADKVQHFAEHVIAERGVRHGRIVLVPTDVLIKPHVHVDGTGHEHPHPHGRGKRRRRAA